LKFYGCVWLLCSMRRYPFDADDTEILSRFVLTPKQQQLVSVIAKAICCYVALPPCYALRFAEYGIKHIDRRELPFLEETNAALEQVLEAFI
jgi:hypothetical protein